MTNTTKTSFKTASKAFNYYLKKIRKEGTSFGDTKALFNIGFTIENPDRNRIVNKEREWKYDYAEAEWQWYLSGDRNISKLGEIYGKIPPIWKRMADAAGNVNSNYGYQWKRNKQLQRVIDLLIAEPSTRQATVSIYDGKEMDLYQTDTPCTYAVQFTVLDNRLNMCVTMRSNDLWYGFCNDQYCFSELQRLVVGSTGYQMGEYFHFAHNLHLYNDKI